VRRLGRPRLHRHCFIKCGRPTRLNRTGAGLLCFRGASCSTVRVAHIYRAMTNEESADVKAFREEQQRVHERRAREAQLVAQYKANLPTIAPVWDTSPGCFGFTEVREDLSAAGLDIFEDPTDLVFSGLQDACLYEASTLWSSLHTPQKIATLIENWSKGIALSPPFFLRHSERNLWMVPDGKHRLTAARALKATRIPFLVLYPEAHGVAEAFPGAKCLYSSQGASTRS
jgi:hypothetical protein